jgi:CRISPR/Cas system CSM-associated protein Csm3 (group 7 of RAMP superfamily)
MRRPLKEELKRINDNTDEKERHEAMTNLIEKKVCDLCRLFGNTMFASRIFFEDGHFDQAETKRVVRDGVGIDRDTGAAAPTVKYDYEVIDPGGSELCFTFGVTVENATIKDKNIILVMLNLLSQGIHLGGKRAGGLGFVALKGGIEVSGFEKPEDGWKLAIDGGTAPLLPAAIETWKKEVFPC